MVQEALPLLFYFIFLNFLNIAQAKASWDRKRRPKQSGERLFLNPEVARPQGKLLYITLLESPPHGPR